jgi:spore coat polysaccharide biosynthesis protein SpsF (cytidylyltransferase family)
VAEESVATFVTARLGSSRLPRKALMPLRGRPVLARVIERVALARVPDRVILCTTAESEDDELEALAWELGAGVHRGSSEDILDRWLGACEAFEVDFFAACDGDNVLCDPGFVDRVVERHRATGAGFVSCEGLPLGTAPLGVGREALARVCELKAETDTAGQARFFQDPDLVSRAVVEAPAELRMEEARLTLDYPEDLELLEAILTELELPDRPVELAEVVELLRSRPDLVAINRGRSEEYWRRFNELYPPVELGSKR